MKNRLRLIATLLAASFPFLRAPAAPQPPAAAQPEPSTPTPYLTPEEELRTIHLPEGYRLELVVSDPVIKEPVVARFDGDGRMFIAEMRSYMQDIDGNNELVSSGRVSLHWSSKHDGVFDRHTVFIDHLKLPRMLLTLGPGELLVNETDSNDLWLYRDTDGDGVADTKTLFYAGGPRGGNLEHQQSGLVWGLDNWIYQAVNAFRLRLDGTNVLREPTAPNGGQWGICQDDYGKLCFVNAGGEVGPLNFQEPVVYGSFRVKNELMNDFVAVWPLVGLADVQGGTSRFRPADGTLNHTTSAAGDEYFRGDRLPAELRGDLFFGEPVGRLVRRSKVEVRDGLTYMSNPYGHSEFIRSTDPNFRPVNLMNAPDGTLYIVDMYRGIIQEGTWVRPGSFLRPKVQKYQLEKNFGRGRVWRIVHQDFQPGPQPRMNEETSAQLVAHLGHPNGWWRETAQKLLVLRQDRSVVPALTLMARSDPNHLARIHALWTLEGLHATDPALLREAMKDPHPQVRIAAIRAGETLYKAGDKSLVPDVLALNHDPDPNVVIQTMMTAHLLHWPDATKMIESDITNSVSLGVREIGTDLIRPPARGGGQQQQFTAAERKLYDHGRAIYSELCFACHGPDGKGAPVPGGKPGETIAPPLGGSQTATGYRDGIISVVLKGLSGQVTGRTYTAGMVPMESNNDEWVASVTSYIRRSFGNRAGMISPGDVARVRASIKDRSEPWTLEELGAALPQPLRGRAQWKVSASLRSDMAAQAIDGSLTTRYTTMVSQAPGQWYQVELPEATLLSGLELDAASSLQDYPRGYEVQLSSDGQTWSKPVAVGKGDGPLTDILFPAAKAKAIRITQTGSVDGLFWSIHELRLYQPGAPVKSSSAAAPKKPANTFE